MQSEFHTEIACSDERLRAAYQLRFDVFTGEQGYDGDRDIDECDEVAVHVVLVRSSVDSVVGVMRILPYPIPECPERFYPHHILENGPLPGGGRTEAAIQAAFLAQQTVQPGTPTVYSGAKIGRIAIQPAYRGRGLGRHLLAGAEAWIAQAIRTQPGLPSTDVAVQVQLSSQVPVRPFYESMGYQIQGDEYLEEGQPHIHCQKLLPVLPM
ncbi:hypothetical protein MNAN1_000579 [Malassezia nana]|uniref:N-acetyltransferase domain-containing protein n=1 Tax=Malassezia nana TaxID=180528 RepID=A0AAF0EJ07_9BASI|nr:hypothetical protein MNAN1_000579 [Malassezia nana]